MRETVQHYKSKVHCREIIRHFNACPDTWYKGVPCHDPWEMEIAFMGLFLRIHCLNHPDHNSRQYAKEKWKIVTGGVLKLRVHTLSI